MKAFVAAALTVVIVSFNAAGAAPLPESKPDDVGFSKRV
jgi:hypothetical protein